METKKFNIIAAKSNIDWTGRKVTGAHNGTIAVKEGYLAFTNQQLTGGRFVIDIKSIRILDVTDPSTNAQFASHLASDDFFSTERYPESILEITSAEPRGDGSYRISGNLSIKGITHTTSFDAGVHVNGNLLNATGKITIDRTLYDIRFRSGNFFKDLGDTLIYNNFDLNITLTAEAVNETVNA